MLGGDVIFDGPIMDWSVMNRIEGSKDSLEQVRLQLSRAMQALYQIKQAREQEKTQLQQEIKQLVHSGR